MFSDQNGTKLEINNKITFEKNSNTWKLNALKKKEILEW